MHGWINDWKKGGNVRQRARQARQPIPWRDGVQAQQVCHWGHGRRCRGQEGDQADSEHKTAMHFFKSIHDDDEYAFESEANKTIQNINNK
ncbi:hypothetical protein FOXYSP1_14316 [Fusarium oxysporum f. sp. phaseoli]